MKEITIYGAEAVDRESKTCNWRMAESMEFLAHFVVHKELEKCN